MRFISLSLYFQGGPPNFITTETAQTVARVIVGYIMPPGHPFGVMPDKGACFTVNFVDPAWEFYRFCTAAPRAAFFLSVLVALLPSQLLLGKVYGQYYLFYSPQIMEEAEASVGIE